MRPERFERRVVPARRLGVRLWEGVRRPARCGELIAAEDCFTFSAAWVMADSAFLSADSISEVASSAVCLAQLLNSLRLSLILCWFCGSRISVRIFSVSPRIGNPRTRVGH